MTNKYFLGIAAAASLATFSQTTAAAGFNYTFAEAGYRNIDSDALDGDGFRVSLSYAATDYLHIVGDYVITSYSIHYTKLYDYQEGFALWQRASSSPTVEPSQPAPHPLRLRFGEPKTLDPGLASDSYNFV